MMAWLKNFRWYDLPNYLLNQVTVGDYASCHADISYAALARQKLDVYVPKQPRADRSMILFSHGGRWQYGQKEDYIFLAQNLAKQGFYVAVMNYQLAPEQMYPRFVEDTILAINWLAEPQQANHYGYSAEHLVLMGHSAGAFNVMAALYHGDDVQYKIQNLQGIRAVIGFAGPYSFEHRGDAVAKDAFAQDVAPEYIMPSFFTFHNQVHHLLLVAGKDTLVGDENSEKMQQALIAVNNHVELVRIRGTSHVSIIASLAQGLDRLFMTKKVMLNFLAR
jgi:acetyl esterase/lipase